MKNGRYSIGEISRLCYVPISKLRYWDESGVIKPCFVDEESGYRYYDNETLLLISVLKYYQSCGFKLREIKTLLQRMDLDHLEQLFDQHITVLNRQILGLTMQRDSILAWRDLIREDRAAMACPDCPYPIVGMKKRPCTFLPPMSGRTCPTKNWLPTLKCATILLHSLKSITA